MSTKNWSSPPKDKNNPESDKMTGLWTEVASLRDKLVHKGLESKRLARRAISPLDESIA